MAIVGIIASFLVLCIAGAMVWRATSRPGGRGGSIGQQLGDASTAVAICGSNGMPTIDGSNGGPKTRRSEQRQRAQQEARRRTPQTFAALEALARANARDAEGESATAASSSHVPPRVAVLSPVEPGGTARDALNEHHAI